MSNQLLPSILIGKNRILGSKRDIKGKRKNKLFLLLKDSKNTARNWEGRAQQGDSECFGWPTRSWLFWCQLRPSTWRKMLWERPLMKPWINCSAFSGTEQFFLSPCISAISFFSFGLFTRELNSLVESGFLHYLG